MAVVVGQVALAIPIRLQHYYNNYELISKPEPGMKNEILTVEAITLREAVQLVIDAFQSWNSNNDLDPGDPFRIIAKLMDALGGLEAGDKFRFWAKLLEQGGELLGLTWKGEDTLKDFNIAKT